MLLAAYPIQRCQGADDWAVLKISVMLYWCCREHCNVGKALTVLELHFNDNNSSGGSYDMSVAESR